MPDNTFPSADNLPDQSPFDSVRKVDEQGNEYWSARELMPLLNYAEWRILRQLQLEKRK